VKAPVLIKLPFLEDRAKVLTERYQRLFTTLAANADAIVKASASGAILHSEALAVMRRHVARLQFDLAELEGQHHEVST
jgi:hypothetical protein